MDVERELREALEQRRRERGDSYLAFGRLLGVSENTYRYFATGNMPISLKTLRRVIAVYPELQELARGLIVPENASIQTL